MRVTGGESKVEGEEEKREGEGGEAGCGGGERKGEMTCPLKEQTAPDGRRYFHVTSGKENTCPVNPELRKCLLVNTLKHSMHLHNPFLFEYEPISLPIPPSLSRDHQSLSLSTAVNLMRNQMKSLNHVRTYIQISFIKFII